MSQNEFSDRHTNMCMSGLLTFDGQRFNGGKRNLGQLLITQLQPSADKSSHSICIVEFCTIKITGDTKT